ncbi:16065_t:CDS:10 [Funneliformis geosporum]|uniref:RNA helicase n=1 Tax=Funneliformis geosporum TaxID=1117311 RepID=A0A9W4SLM8_9GLOM|nr:16065_t:CDS:10 [Funneliformis geosporum]
MNNNPQDSSKRVGNWGPRQAPNLDPNRQWAALRRRYEWNDSYDDTVAPRDQELENELFGEENHVHTGINFAKYSSIKVSVKPEGTITPVPTFDEANLHSAMKDNIKLARYSVPTPVQLFGKAKKLAAPRPPAGARRFKAEPLVLIIAPTRELATQIFDECRRFTYRSMMRPCVVYGGADSLPQKNELAKGCDVLTATPGRLNDFVERGFISLRRVKYLILDEADRMLDMGFENDIRKIVQKSDLCDDGTRQTLMFSATFPKSIRSLAKDFLAEKYIFLTVGRLGSTTSDITQKIMYVEDQGKRNSLVELLLKQPPSRTLIFVETKRGADSLDDYLYNQNFPTTSIHGDRTQREREDALISFKNGRSPILIATAVAARGLDIKNVMHVINYDLCNDIDEYVHRIGRTARVGNQGLATTFYNERNSEIAPELVKILQQKPGWDAKNTWDGKPSWDANQPVTSSTVQNDGWSANNSVAPQQPPPQPSYQSFQPQGMPSYANQPPPQSPSQFSQPQYGGTSPKVNLPKSNIQYGTNPQQSYGYNAQTPQSYGSGGYGNPSNNGPRQNYYNNDDTNRFDDSINDNYQNASPSRPRSESPKNQRNQLRMESEVRNDPPPNSDSWGNPGQQQNKPWDPSHVPW